MMREEYSRQDDWFHHGEGNMYFYLLALMDPTDYELVVAPSASRGST